MEVGLEDVLNFGVARFGHFEVRFGVAKRVDDDGFAFRLDVISVFGEAVSSELVDEAGWSATGEVAEVVVEEWLR